MVTIRSVQEIISSLLDFYKLAQPDLDTKPGTVARDLFVEGPSSALSLIYDELAGVSNKQSIRLVTGTDLDKLALNFGLTRKQATPASGVALLTFASINATININPGDLVIANNGLSFSVVNGVSVTPAAANFYRSIASQFSAQLAYVGISDQFAVEVTVTATAAGSSGNIGTFALNQTSIPGVSNVTNVVAFAGGTDQETDASFRNRILSNFSGSSVGTSLGFLNAALAVTGVADAVVVGPGNPLMTRDGTVVENGPNNSLTIVSEGSGGKVDIYVMGQVLTENTDTFIYQDKSNKNDPTNSANDFVLGQLAADAGLTINQKRIKDIAAGQLPAQPVQNILQVTGSGSGSNFIPATTNSFGITTGNYKLVKDTGVYAGSPWGSDKFVWTDDKVSYQEDLIKGQPYGQDATTFTSLLAIPKIQQNLSITNENSKVDSSNRSLITLLHTPATNVTRVYNVNTGERYVIVNQNYNNTSPFNNTGVIQISGNTLPSPSDILQVDYNWIVSFDRYSDYDGLVDTFNARPVNNSVDWGYASNIHKERVLFTLNPGNNFYTGTVSHPVNTVITAQTFQSVDGYVQTVTSGTYINRLSVVISFLSAPPSSIDFIKLKNSNSEVYNTAQNNGTFNVTSSVIGTSVVYQATIILPTDTPAVAGNQVTVTMNSADTFFAGSSQGNVTGNQITIPSASVNSTSSSLYLDVTYIALVSDLFSSGTTTLPTSRSGNGYLLSNNNGFNNFSIVNTSKRENLVVQENLSNQFYVEISAPVVDFSITTANILSVVRLRDGAELWNSSNQGSLFTGSTSGNYQVILSGYNTPAQGDRVLIVYYATDIRRFQPFSFSNSILNRRVDVLSQDAGSGQLYVPINNFSPQASGMSFNVIDPITGITYFTITDGNLVYMAGSSVATVSSASTNFGTLANLTNLKIQIINSISANNIGLYDIVSYNSTSNYITITTNMINLTADQICIVRLLDGKEQWNYSGTIKQSDNKLLLPKNISGQPGDLVFTFFFNYKNLRQASTPIIGTTADQVVNTGIMTVNGTTLTKVENVVFTATATGLKQNVAAAIRTFLGLNSTASIPSNVRLAKIINLSKVITVSTTNNTVLETLVNYDVINTTIQNNLYYSDDMLSDTTLQSLDFVLPGTTNNTLSSGVTPNVPQIGDKLQITFYYITDNVSENLSYTRNGTLYTDNRFALINKIYVSSGFNTSQSTKFTATSFTQPALGSRYTVFYNYTAPQQNERIVITYNYNALVSTTTFAIENSRPVNADVLVKAAIEVPLDLTMNIVIDSTMINSSTTVLQNVRNAVIAILTSTKLGQTVTQTALINAAQGVTGVDQARVVYFNINGQSGTVLQIPAQQNQYFVANNVVINSETL